MEIKRILKYCEKTLPSFKKINLSLNDKDDYFHPITKINSAISFYNMEKEQTIKDIIFFPSKFNQAFWTTLLISIGTYDNQYKKLKKGKKYKYKNNILSFEGYRENYKGEKVVRFKTFIKKKKKKLKSTIEFPQKYEKNLNQLLRICNKEKKLKASENVQNELLGEYDKLSKYNIISGLFNKNGNKINNYNIILVSQIKKTKIIFKKIKINDIKIRNFFNIKKISKSGELNKEPSGLFFLSPDLYRVSEYLYNKDLSKYIIIIDGFKKFDLSFYKEIENSNIIIFTDEYDFSNKNNNKFKNFRKLNWHDDFFEINSNLYKGEEFKKFNRCFFRKNENLEIHKIEEYKEIHDIDNFRYEIKSKINKNDSISNQFYKLCYFFYYLKRNVYIKEKNINKEVVDNFFSEYQLKFGENKKAKNLKNSFYKLIDKLKNNNFKIKTLKEIIKKNRNYEILIVVKSNKDKFDRNNLFHNDKFEYKIIKFSELKKLKRNNNLNKNHLLIFTGFYGPKKLYEQYFKFRSRKKIFLFYKNESKIKNYYIKKFTNNFPEFDLEKYNFFKKVNKEEVETSKKEKRKLEDMEKFKQVIFDKDWVDDFTFWPNINKNRYRGDKDCILVEFTNGKYSFMNKNHRVYLINIEKNQGIKRKEIKNLKINDIIITLQSDRDLLDELELQYLAKNNLGHIYEKSILWRNALLGHQSEKNFSTIKAYTEYLNSKGINKTTATISTWLSGNVIGPQDINDIDKIYKITGSKRMKDKVEDIKIAIKKRKKLHIKLSYEIHDKILENIPEDIYEYNFATECIIPIQDYGKVEVLKISNISTNTIKVKQKYLNKIQDG